ncbi:hypothetical protein DAEQUDRAFT_385518 [Daedalea quercina L-15889]|uniref:SprT-like domain-containing protein n=1 Tax=Daedalea quercina L-15889 TaxID=1314783 RepID=A0A165P201_9APHY|nr:hypothetical protein DAEQUDRAFT_385518 [Daedalea quercina L-15889]
MGPIIDLTVSSSESESEDPVPANTSRVNIKPTQRPTSRSAVSHRPTSSQDDGLRSTIPLYADDDSDGDDPMDNNDGSILVLDEPRSARKPLRTANLSHPTRKIPSASVPSTPIRRIVSIHSTDSEKSDTDVESEASVRSAKPAARPKKTTATKAPRLSKKALEAAEQQRRERYAKTFFDEMNRTVFGHGLPDNTTLYWNKRLVSTAGKAKWQRNREGVQTSEIELAVKILTSDERIRNTLSHEMCHLASWIISDDPTENHGSIFHGWANKIMRARPEIEITTKHNYEIDYKYEWKCLECAKVYGRFSKSINPDECVCGACKVGKLIPLFATNTRAPKTPRNKAGSAMASAKGRDSPLATSSPFLLREENVNIRVDIHVPRGAPSSVWKAKTKTRIPGAFPLGDDEDDYDDEDDDVEVLTRAIGGVKL